jgi:DNA mismatch repair protein MLH3
MHSDVSSTSLKPSPWLATVLDGWENPIFQWTEPSIPQLSLAGEVEYVLHGHRHNCTQLDIRRAFSEVSSGIQGRISKQALRKAEIIGQVDKKFILIKLSNPGRKAEEEKTLVIIDQHAADERIRVENLLAELCTTPASRPGQKPSESGVCTVYLDRSIVVEVSETDIDLLGRKQAQFAKWGICYDLPVMEKNLAAQEAAREAGSKKKLAVRSLPSGIVERCKSDPKLLLDLIRTELYSSSKKSQSFTKSPNDALEVDGKSWLKQIHSCPQGIIDMLNSRACRSAIMFNDVLSTEQCEVLLSMLAGTAFPFQCAHGRPTLLPLVELGSLAWNLESVRRSEQAGGDFGRDFRKWRLNASNQ